MPEVFISPVIVDFAGDEHHGNWFHDFGRGTLVCVNPNITGVEQLGNVIYMHGGFEGAPLPPDTADHIHLTMVLSAICFFGIDPGTVVMRTIETAKAFAKPDAELEVLDMAYTIETAEEFLKGRGIPLQRRNLDWKNPDDRALCNIRSAHAIRHHEVGLALLTIPLATVV